LLLLFVVVVFFAVVIPGLWERYTIQPFAYAVLLQTKAQGQRFFLMGFFAGLSTLWFFVITAQTHRMRQTTTTKSRGTN